MQTLSKAKVKMKLKGWANEANEIGTSFLKRKLELDQKAYDYKMKIIKSFTTVGVRELPPDETELADEYARQLNGLYDLEKMKELPAYSLLNPLAALRIYHRKLERFERTLYQERKPLQKLLEELKIIDQASRKYVGKFELEIKAYRMMMQDLLAEKLNGSDGDYWLFVESLFFHGRKLKRDDFLQVITVDKSLKHWDGGLIKPYRNRVADIPEEIDFDTFQKFVVVERIEADRDSYLFDIWMEHFFKVKEEYKKQTGEEAFDTLKIFEDITGKPLQTFTAKCDEYGDVVSVTPNKPNLRLVKDSLPD